MFDWILSGKIVVGEIAQAKKWTVQRGDAELSECVRKRAQDGGEYAGKVSGREHQRRC